MFNCLAIDISAPMNGPAIVSFYNSHMVVKHFHDDYPMPGLSTVIFLCDVDNIAGK